MMSMAQQAKPRVEWGGMEWDYNQGQVTALARVKAQWAI